MQAMQPTLQKAQTIDQAGQLQRRQQQHAPGSGKNNLLTHSVSIVVELAREQLPVGLESLVRAAGEPYAVDSGGADEDADVDDVELADVEVGAAAAAEVDEEEDDDDGGCLSSELARKVVIVDEADKILMSRAHSAEPRFAPSRCADGSEHEPGMQRARSPAAGEKHREDGQPAIGPVPMDTGASAAEANCSHQRPRTNLAGTCSNATPANELAERGELSQLSRKRRNTHHHLASGCGGIQLSPLAGAGVLHLPRPHSAAASAQPPSEPGGGVAATTAQHPRGAIGPAQLLAPATPSWSHRRQSLQMSLFTGACRSADGPGKSLTEEELRGEREFNEQVRSARSPEILSAATSAAASHPSVALASVASSPLVAASGHLRCRSVVGAGCSLAGVGSGGKDQATPSASSGASLPLASGASPATNRKGSFQISHSNIKSQHKQPHERRRVSFSFVDPYPSSADRPHQLHLLQDLGADKQNYPHPHSHPHPHPHLHQSEQPAPDSQASTRQRPSSGCILDGTWRVGAKQTPPSSSSDAFQSQHLAQTSGKPPQTAAVAAARRKRHSVASGALANLWRQTTHPGDRANNPFCSRCDSHSLAGGQWSDRQSGAIKVTSSPEEFAREMSEHEGENENMVAEPNETSSALGADSVAEREAAVEPQVDSLSGKPLNEEPLQLGLDEDQDHGEDDDHSGDRVSSTIITGRTRETPSAQQNDGGRVQSIMANAKLRQEEFARLLAEHEQIVNEINRVETKISNSQTANALRLQQQQQQQANEHQ